MPASLRPDPSEYDPRFERYVSLVPAGDLVTLLDAQADAFGAWAVGVRAAHASHRYADGKWSVREVVGHMSDTERIFATRALRIARGDTTPLPSFDENAYVAHSGFEARSMRSLAAEFDAVRSATTALLRGLPAEAWRRSGTASGCPVSVRALACILYGHAAHHLDILADRYAFA